MFTTTENHPVMTIILCVLISDPSFTTAEVTSVLESVKDWDSLLKGYLISKPLLAAIKSRCSTDGDIASEGASYYVSCYPKPSWTHLAGWLYRFEEFSAMEKCKPFLPLRGKYTMLYASTVHNQL